MFASPRRDLPIMPWPRAVATGDSRRSGSLVPLHNRTLDWGKLWLRIFPTSVRTFRTTAKHLRLVVASPGSPGVENSLLRSPASKGITAFLSAAHAAGRRAARIAVAVAIASALVARPPRPSQAAADELVAHRARVKQQITKTKSDLNESTKALSKAAVAVDKAQNKLDAASAQLAATRQELTAAQVKDAQMEGRLRQARSDLAAAVAAVAAGQARLNAEQAKAGQLIRDQYQQQTNLLPVAVLVDPHSTEDWQTRLQWSTTLFDTTQAQIDRLTVLQRQLNAARVRQADLEAKVAAARREAAANLKIKRSLEVTSYGRGGHRRAARTPAKDSRRSCRDRRRPGQGPVFPVDQGTGIGGAAHCRADRQGRRSAASVRPSRRRTRRGGHTRPASGRTTPGIHAQPRRVPATASRSLWQLRSPHRSACASIRCCTTGSCTMAPTSAPRVARRFGPPTPVGSPSGITTPVTETG